MTLFKKWFAGVPDALRSAIRRIGGLPFASAPLNVDIAGDSHIGKRRKSNQDAFWHDPILRAFAVADGMGGENAGEVASAQAIQHVARLLGQAFREEGWIWPETWPKASSDPNQGPESTLLRYVTLLAHEAILRASRETRAWRGMGTTLTIGIISGTSLFLSHAGDSRVYLLRRGQWRQLTRDQTRAQQLMDARIVTVEVDPRHPTHSQLVSCVGGTNLEIQSHQESVERGDRILFCTDGVYRPIPAERLPQTVGQQDFPLDKIVAQMIDDANSRGGPDNITALLVEVL
ncbi:PP2C family protein-serine/threonine phosphatase [Sulfidibacter corallicola]|uniref:Serine/threonine-protein phosphatase n=1 Tax=Sulfidibacter corallicola TaxID=2818388 RepID=A0A8A4TPX1_SULCO|nr:protein phosphatase 2C domain-containing protein [Sulfidibacter corallicola]QTD48615.1 serine/threonine-protein phosphatase [Sulfidibacter corallicola]